MNSYSYCSTQRLCLTRFVLFIRSYSFAQHCCKPNVVVQNVFVDTQDLRFPWVAFFAQVTQRRPNQSPVGLGDDLIGSMETLRVQ